MDQSLLTHHFCLVGYELGRRAGVGRGLGVGVALGVDVGVGVGVGPWTSKDPLSMRPLTTRSKPGPR
jgi:hypothetical protein